MLSCSLSLSVTISIRIVFIVVIIIVIIITITVEHVLNCHPRGNWRSDHLIKGDRLMQVSQNTRKQEGSHFHSHSSLIKTWKSTNVNYYNFHYFICMTIIVITLPIRSTFVSNNVLFLSHVRFNWTSIIDTSTLTMTKSLLRSAISWDWENAGFKAANRNKKLRWALLRS